MYNIAIGACAAVLYLISGSLLGVRLSRIAGGAKSVMSKTRLVAMAAVAAILHGLFLIQLIMQADGINLGFFNALSLASLLIVVILLLLGLLSPVENLGIVLLPFSAVSIVLVLLFPSQRMISDSASWPLEVHIIISIIAYALLAMATVQALLLAIQDYRLRHHQPGGMLRGIPPLTTMETLLFQMIAAGFVTLSLALLSGFLFLEDVFAQHLVHKTTLSIVAWLVFGILLWGRWRFGWRGRTALRWTLGGFITLMLAYFGSKLVLELILQRVG
jgi:ABC-type uncharacterized transport system permease subunit